MSNSAFNLQSFWEALLSRQPSTIRSKFTSLTEAEKSAVVQHLEHMASAPGWHPEQRLSAQIALEAIRTMTHDSREGDDN